MTSLPGAQQTIALKLGSTFGTATALGSGDKLIGATVSRNENVTPLERTPIGSGDAMKSSSQRGKVSPSVSLNGELGYNNPAIAGIVQMFGAQSTMSMGSGAYTHSIYFNETANSKWATLGHVPVTGSVIEYASMVATKLALTVQDPADYLKYTLDFLANQEKTSGTTNSAATIEATTEADTYPVVVQTTDEFLINQQDGVALATSTHRQSIKAIEITYERPQEHIYEIRGAAGNSSPLVAGDVPFKGTLKVTFKDLNDAEFFLWQNSVSGTEYKASLTVTDSTLIGGGFYRKLTLNFPRLKMTGSPEYSVGSAGRNEVSLTFDMMVATTNPTGMIDRYPYILLINGKSTDY